MKKSSHLTPIIHHVPTSNDALLEQGCALTIGNFDGVHAGHQVLLAHLKRISGNLPTCVMTFAPHPRAYFSKVFNRPEMHPRQISTLRNKIKKIRSCGIDHIFVARFNEAMASMDPEQFISEILIKRFHIKHLLVGQDFCFGNRRSGNIALLKEYAKKYDYTVHTIEDVLDIENQRFSSSRVRELLGQGDIDTVNDYLRHPFTISGRVSHGKKLGREIGIPTINIPVSNACALRHGVYVTRVKGLSDSAIPAIASIGLRPTTDNDNKVLLEAHLLDTKIDAYGKLVDVEFLRFVRDEKKFPSLQTMINAIQDDIGVARLYFDVHGL